MPAKEAASENRELHKAAVREDMPSLKGTAIFTEGKAPLRHDYLVLFIRIR
jgi:hypothetical protein